MREYIDSYQLVTDDVMPQRDDFFKFLKTKIGEKIRPHLPAGSWGLGSGDITFSDEMRRVLRDARNHEVAEGEFSDQGAGWKQEAERAGEIYLLHGRDPTNEELELMQSAGSGEADYRSRRNAELLHVRSSLRTTGKSLQRLKVRTACWTQGLVLSCIAYAGLLGSHSPVGHPKHPSGCFGPQPPCRHDHGKGGSPRGTSPHAGPACHSGKRGVNPKLGEDCDAVQYRSGHSPGLVCNAIPPGPHPSVVVAEGRSWAQSPEIHRVAGRARGTLLPSPHAGHSSLAPRPHARIAWPQGACGERLS